MKHKRFNEVYPYTYFLKNIETGVKYYGVRYANINKNKKPVQDFGVKYFTSGRLAKDFKQNPEKYKFRICWTFDSIAEAVAHERKVLLKIYTRTDWANNSVSSAIINFTDEIRNNISKSLYKPNFEGVRPIDIITEKVIKSKKVIQENGLTLGKWASLKAAETMQNTFLEDGESIQSHRLAKTQATMSEVGKDGLNRYQRAGSKISTTKKKIGKDGLTVGQRAAIFNPCCIKGTKESLDISKKRNQTYNKKLVKMSDEEFQQFLQGKSELWQSLTTARRNKAIKLTGKE